MLKLKVPPPLYFLFIIGLMWLLDRYFPVFVFNSLRWDILVFILVSLGIILDAFAVIHFFKEQTTINPFKPKNTNKLVITGLYHFTRNPMYLGLLSLLVAWSIWLGSLSALIFIPIFIKLITVQQIMPEEQILEQKFGQQYRDYLSSVRRWI